MNRARESVEVGLVFSDPDGAETTEREMESLSEELDQLPLLRMEHRPAPPAPRGTRAGDVTVYRATRTTDRGELHCAVPALGCGARGVKAFTVDVNTPYGPSLGRR